MLSSYLKVFARNLWKHKLFSFIGIGGLAIGMTCFLLILFYVRFERSYDDFHVKGDRIYRVIRENVSEGQSETKALVGSPIAPRLMQEFSAIEGVVRFTNLFEGTVCANDNCFREASFFFADSSVFDVFTFPLRWGDPKSALREPFCVVISPQAAHKYFGDVNPLNRTLTYQLGPKEKTVFKITGILKEIPGNSHIKFDFLASYSSLYSIVGKAFVDERWDDTPTWVYVLLRPGYSADDLERQFPAFIDKYADKSHFTSITYSLQPLRDIYFGSLGMGAPIGDFGIQPISVMLLLMGGMILLIGCINFMNLSTVRSVTRAREIGVRKVLGADRFRLMKQFLSESLLYAFAALLVAMALVELLRPAFQAFIANAFPTFGLLPQRSIHLPLLPNLLVLVIVAFVVGMISGLYPAYVLARMNAAHVIKGEIRSRRSSAWLRQFLVVGQFVAAATLTVCALVVARQVNHMKSKDMGFNREFVLTVRIDDRTVVDRYELFKNQLLQNPAIRGVTAVSQVPGVTSANGTLIRSEGIEDAEMVIIYVDADYVKTLGLSLANGRDFSSANREDAGHAFLMNETAMKKLGWHNAAGQDIELYWKTRGLPSTAYRGNLIGVLKDFDFREFNMPTQPLILAIDTRRMSYLLVRISLEDVAATIDFIRKTWQGFHFSQNFECSFLSDEMNKVYGIYDTVGALVTYAAVIVMCIAGVGLFALSYFIVQRKTKEIGIRKAFGASTSQIVRMLSTSFLKWIVLANLIAAPCAYYLMNQFLQGFTYRIGLDWGVFAITAFVTLGFAFLTVVYQAVRAAMANPIDALRYE